MSKSHLSCLTCIFTLLQACAWSSPPAPRDVQTSWSFQDPATKSERHLHLMNNGIWTWENPPNPPKDLQPGEVISLATTPPTYFAVIQAPSWGLVMQRLTSGSFQPQEASLLSPIRIASLPCQGSSPQDLKQCSSHQGPWTIYPQAAPSRIKVLPQQEPTLPVLPLAVVHATTSHPALEQPWVAIPRFDHVMTPPMLHVAFAEACPQLPLPKHVGHSSFEAKNLSLEHPLKVDEVALKHGADVLVSCPLDKTTRVHLPTISRPRPFATSPMHPAMLGAQAIVLQELSPEVKTRVILALARITRGDLHGLSVLLNFTDKLAPANLLALASGLAQANFPEHAMALREAALSGKWRTDQSIPGLLVQAQIQESLGFAPQSRATLKQIDTQKTSYAPGAGTLDDWVFWATHDRKIQQGRPSPLTSKPNPLGLWEAAHLLSTQLLTQAPSSPPLSPVLTDLKLPLLAQSLLAPQALPPLPCPGSDSPCVLDVHGRRLASWAKSTHEKKQQKELFLLPYALLRPGFTRPATASQSPLLNAARAFFLPTTKANLEQIVQNIMIATDDPAWCQAHQQDTLASQSMRRPLGSTNKHGTLSWLLEDALGAGCQSWEALLTTATRRELSPSWRRYRLSALLAKATSQKLSPQVRFARLRDFALASHQASSARGGELCHTVHYALISAAVRHGAKVQMQTLWQSAQRCPAPRPQDLGQKQVAQRIITQENQGAPLWFSLSATEKARFKKHLQTLSPWRCAGLDPAHEDNLSLYFSDTIQALAATLSPLQPKRPRQGTTRESRLRHIETTWRQEWTILLKKPAETRQSAITSWLAKQKADAVALGSQNLIQRFDFMIQALPKEANSPFWSTPLTPNSPDDPSALALTPAQRLLVALASSPNQSVHQLTKQANLPDLQLTSLCAARTP